MRSTAQLKGHPLHPILICLPIAFYLGTLVFDALAVVYENIEFSVTGKYLNIAGIAGAVMAAVPGVIDYLGTVPPDSSAKKRAGKHGLLNVLALLLFVVSLYFKYREEPHVSIILGLEIAAVGATFVAGWLGGTLVFRNQIGVDIRYAASARWEEIHLTEKEGPWQICASGDLRLNQMKLVHVNKKRLVVARTENGVKAFEDRCPHKGGSLAGGSMMCGTVQCPWHGSQFSVEDGSVKCGPAKEKIKTFSLAETDGKIFLLSVD